jgi:hypothetical protein
MNRRRNRPKLRALHALDVAPATPDLTRVVSMDVSEFAAGDGGHFASAPNNPENSEILVAACGIVINGYRAEISRGRRDSLFVQAAYQLLHGFLEREFAAHSGAA